MQASEFKWSSEMLRSILMNYNILQASLKESEWALLGFDNSESR